MSLGAVPLEVRPSDYVHPGAITLRQVPVEMPVAIEINGIAYAVMMATPCDLEDFITGFVLSEGLASAAEIGPIAVEPVGGGEGLVARLNLPPARLAPLMERARRRLGDSSCGICGIESVEAALRPLPRLKTTARIEERAIRAALRDMRQQQHLGAQTAATHAAAFARADGKVLVVREDVGRHNALDKAVGALARQAIDPASGFLIVTSRCSYELVEKTARAGCPLLVAISAPTDLAIRRARSAGVALAVLARDDGMMWAAGPPMESDDGL